MRRSLAPALAALALALAGCGGDDEETTTLTGGTGATDATGATGETVSADEVVSCLGDAGYDAGVSDSTVLGLEAQHEKVDVAIEDLEQGAVVIVFESAEAAEAEEEAADATAGVAEVTVAGNVIWGVDAAVDDDAAAEAAIEGCVPAS